MAGQPRGRTASTIPDERVLAAVDRAARHDTSLGYARPRAALWNNVIVHLGLRVAGGAGTRLIRAPMGRLEKAGLIVGTSYERTSYWMLTVSGQRKLAKVRAAGRAILPESPQHRDWREAREFADRELPFILDDLHGALASAMVLCRRNVPAHSDEWFEISARLHLHSWQAASALHILDEWPEPDEDGGPDIDTAEEARDDLVGRWERVGLRFRRKGRRDTWRWYSDLLPQEMHCIRSTRLPPREHARYE